MNFLTALMLVFGLWFVVAMVVALPVMWLWDWLMPTLFGLTEITWPQAMGLCLLCSMLFKANVEVKK
jgi:hypothetical protein